MDNFLDFIRKFLPSQTFTDMPQSVQAVQPASPTPTPVNNFTPEQVRPGIAGHWGEDNPILANLETYLMAGQQLNQQFGIDPLLPIIMALRETQGGKDLLDPKKLKGENEGLGTNNVFNIRNNTGAFQNYPDLNTAIMGNLGQGGQSGGLTGLLSGAKPSSKGIYQDFRNNPDDLTQLFSHWSPPQDKNGPLDEQVQNYNWIKNAILGGG